MHSIQSLGFDEIILAPSKSRLVPVPLFMTTSEQCVKDVFRPKEGDVVVDVGTYIGRFTLIASKCVGKSGKVIGVEPNPENFEIVRRNVQMNQSTNVVLLNAAASNREGILRMYKGPAGGWTTIQPISDRFFDAPCIKLDTSLEKLGIEKVDWMKIDVEGAGLLVLEGSARILRRSEDLKLIVEIHTWTDEAKIIDLLEQYGYRARRLEPIAKIYHIMATKKRENNMD